MAPENEETARSMQNLPVLDLSGVRSRDEVSALRLRNIAIVLVPEDMPDLLSGADCMNIAAVVPVPAGIRVETRTGQVEISGDSLAAGNEHTILTLVGQVVVTPEVTQVGYRGVILIGHVLLPKSAERALAGKIINQTGQIVYYEGGTNLRVFMEDVCLTKAFFDLVEEPMTLVLVGDSTFSVDVTPEVLRQKVRSIALVGDATVENPDLQPVIQFMAKTMLGSVSVGAVGGGSAS